MPLQPDFRAYYHADLAELEQMMFGLYAEDPEGESLTGEKIIATVDEFAQYLEKGRIVMFTVEQMIVGYGLVIVYWSNEHGGNILHIDELYVKPKWRGQGLATQFLITLSESEPATTKALQLEVTPSNPRALAYYRRLGFVPSSNTHLRIQSDGLPIRGEL